MAARSNHWIGPLYLLVWCIGLGPCGYTLIELNTIDCGGDPQVCEPAVHQAATRTAAALAALAAGAFVLAAARRRLGRDPLADRGGGCWR